MIWAAVAALLIVGTRIRRVQTFISAASIRSRIREYSTRAVPTQRAERGGSMAIPVSAKVYSARLRSISYAIRALNSGVGRRTRRSTPNVSRSSCGR